MEDSFTSLFIFFVILVALAMVATGVGCAIEVTKVATNKEVVTEQTVEVEIVRLDITVDSGEVFYFATIKGENVSEVLEISETEFTTLQEGDRISVCIKHTDNSKLPDEREVTIVH